jgi:hypothetical protein
MGREDWGRRDEFFGRLRQRLHHERNISAASTWDDRDSAEAAVGAAIAQQNNKIARWLERDSHPNLVLGRTLRRGEEQVEPCAHAVIVLKWDGGNSYHVLTAYPECRSWRIIKARWLERSPPPISRRCEVFLRGYFHQDMKDEYDSPEDAIREFCADASSEERTAVAKDWSSFLAQTKGKPLEEINRVLVGPLGSSCILSGEDLRRISAVLSRRSGKPGPR